MVLARPGCKLIGNYASQEPCLITRALDMEQFSEYGFPRQREHSEIRRNIRTEKKWLVHRYLTQGQFAHPTHNQLQNQAMQPVRISYSYTYLRYLTPNIQVHMDWVCKMGG